MESLTEKEKLTLSWMLKEKIKTTLDLEDNLRNQLNQTTEDGPARLLDDVLESVYSQRNNCYEIARKLGIK